MLRSFVLERILSGETTEVVLEQIQEYLTSLGNQVRDGRIPLDDFQIFKVSFKFHLSLIDIDNALATGEKSRRLP